MMGGFELPVKAMRQQISSAVDLIIQANRLQGGPRKITSITEVMNMEQDIIIMQEVFRYKQVGHRPERPRVRPVRGDRRAADIHQPAGSEGRQVAVEHVRRTRPDEGLIVGIISDSDRRIFGSDRLDATRASPERTRGSSGQRDSNTADSHPRSTPAQVTSHEPDVALRC